MAGWYFNLRALLLDLDSPNQIIMLVGVVSSGAAIWWSRCSIDRHMHGPSKSKERKI